MATGKMLASHERPRTRPTFQRDIVIEDSDWINVVRYCRRTKILDLVTKKGVRYRYWQVTAEVFADVITAKSGGRAFNRLVRNNPRIPYAKMRSRPAT